MLAATSTSRTLQKVEEVLKRIAQGLLLNESATHVEVFQFCHLALVMGCSDETAGREGTRYNFFTCI